MQVQKVKAMLRTLLSVLSFAAVSGCGGGGSSPSTDSVADQAALTGADGNGNGIRDSIEPALNSYSTDAKTSTLVTSAAVRAQALLAPVPSTPALAQGALTAKAETIACARVALSLPDATAGILEAERLTYDSTARRQRFEDLRTIAGSFELDQNTWSDPGATC